VSLNRLCWDSKGAPTDLGSRDGQERRLPREERLADPEPRAAGRRAPNPSLSELKAASAPHA